MAHLYTSCRELEKWQNRSVAAMTFVLGQVERVETIERVRVYTRIFFCLKNDKFVYVYLKYDVKL